MTKLQDVIEFNAGDNKNLKECKYCKKYSFKSTFLGKADNGNKIFEGKCLLGCTTFLYMITNKGKFIRTGNLNE